MNLHLVSDATGETLNAITRATVVQFEHARVVYHRWSLIRSRLQLKRVIDSIEAEPGPVLSTLVDRALRHELEQACSRLGLKLVHVLDPVLAMLQEQFGEAAMARPGQQYVLDASYFRRIDAIHYVIAHDDGQARSGIVEADVVLVGVSRTSKTPTSFYLANRGIKAANVPLIPGVALPGELDLVKCPVIGLTLEPAVLVEIRHHRLRVIGFADKKDGWQNRADYVNLEAVKAELLWARRLCSTHSWPVIDVSRRSIEETAATIIQYLENWQEKNQKPILP